MNESREGELIGLGRELAEASEPGFFEHRTQAILAERFRARGFKVREFSGMTGFLAGTGGSRQAQRLAVVADMDALPQPGASSPGSVGAYAHTCGHNLQMTALFGAACLLRERHPKLAARVAFLATPAEEYVELERREALRREGRVRALSGKQELLQRGAFAGFQVVVATHAASPRPGEVSSVLAMNGFEVLRWSFRGASAHAGAHPHRGRNAQNAAVLFLQARAFLRESFPEDRHVRIHPVLRLPPDQPVNLIPETAAVETYVRAVDPKPSRAPPAAWKPRRPAAARPSGWKWGLNASAGTPPSARTRGCTPCCGKPSKPAACASWRSHFRPPPATWET